MHYSRLILNQIEEFLNYCRKYDELLIYGAAENQELLARFMKICGMKVKGFLVSSIDDERPLVYNEYPKMIYDASMKLDSNVGIILGLHDKYYNEIWRNLTGGGGIREIIFVSGTIKVQIANKLRVRKAKDARIEINLVEHCNLNCYGCDHYSQLAKPEFLELNEFEKDIKRLSELTNCEIGRLVLLGGEPLLHKDVVKFGQIARAYLPKTKIVYTTNGLLLGKMKSDFWASLNKNNCTIQLTRYPIKIDIKKIYQMALEHDVVIDFFTLSDRYNSLSKTSDTYALDTSGTQSCYNFIACEQMNKCTVLRKGKIYQCPSSAHVGHFNRFFNQRLVVCERDYIDIYKADSWEEIAKHISNPVPFCRYCDIKNRSSQSWKQSQKTIDEYLGEDEF